MRGRCPRAPGIQRFRARMAAERGGLRRPRHSGPWTALRSHPCGAVSSAQVLPVYAVVDQNRENELPATVPARYNNISPASVSLAGFEVSLIGRF